MRSRAELRRVIETVLRAVSIAILAWMLWLSLDRGEQEVAVSARTANLASALREWSVGGIAPDRITVELDSIPLPRERAWLAALRGAGSRVEWNGDLVPIGIAVHQVASPRGGLSVLVAAPDGEPIRVSDEVGTIDTAQALNGGARFTVPGANGILMASARGTSATAFPNDILKLRSVLVLGAAGWESKFVVAALEEDGWKVDAQMRVAPGASVTQGTIGPIDTARFSAVIALDASAAPYGSAIAQYVASGGGLVIASGAAAIRSFTQLRAGPPGRIDASTMLASEPGATTLKSLSLAPIAAIRADAIILDRRDGVIAAAARRHIAGRVVQHGYADTWRWRMSGGDRSVADHRAWWTRAISSVAYAPRVGRSDIDGMPASADSTSRSMQPPIDSAPYARLIESLGPPSQDPEESLMTVSGSTSLWWLFVLLSACLLAEWTSRRLRGSR